MGRYYKRIKTTPEDATIDYLKKATVTALVLQILTEKPCYAQEIGEILSRKSGGRIQLAAPPYTSLQRLSDRGYIKEIDGTDPEKGRKRRFYRITASGRRHMEAQRRILAQYFHGVQMIVSLDSGSPEALADVCPQE